MRILYVVSLFPCWSETFIVREIQELMRRGADIRILSLRQPKEQLVHPEAQALLDRTIYPHDRLFGISTAMARFVAHCGPVLRTSGEAVGSLARRPLSLAKTAIALQQCLAGMGGVYKFRPDHVHSHWGTYASTAGLQISRILCCGFSFTCHAHDIFLEDHQLARKLRECRFAATISNYNIDFLQRKYGGIAREKVKLVRCGVRVDEFLPRPAQPESGQVFAIGRLDPIKGFDVLVKACARLRDQGRKMECSIAGDGPERARLLSQIERLGLEANVHLVGAKTQSEVRRMLLESRMCVLPSVVDSGGNMDGIPVALMEAMALGVPVVSTNVSGIPELVVNERTGLSVVQGDSNALSGSIARLLDDSHLASRLAQAGRQKVEQEFNIQTEAGRLYELMLQARGAVR